MDRDDEHEEVIVRDDEGKEKLVSDLSLVPAQSGKDNPGSVELLVMWKDEFKKRKDEHKEVKLDAKKVSSKSVQGLKKPNVEYDHFKFLQFSLFGKPLLRLCYLFPPDYEFYDDDTKQLWFLLGGTNLGMLDTPSLQFSRVDHSTGFPLYKLNKITIADLQNHFNLNGGGGNDEECLSIADVGSSIRNTTQHISVRVSIDSSFLGKMYKAKALQTLLILRGYGSRINYVPPDLFHELPFLQTLDLSNTNITELPSSIGYSRKLRYLNLSHTSIVELPNSLCNIFTLETLKLRGCLKLKSLPKAIRQLRSLQHLDVDVSCLLVSMPPGVGDLKQLEILPAFVVGKQHGWRITELRSLKYLCRDLHILRLENLSSAEEAKKADLFTLYHLRKLEYNWSQFVDGLEVLQNLQPTEILQELQIIGYGGSKFPSWIGDDIYHGLTTLTIHNCSKCDALPPIGRLPALKFLHISDMNEVKVIDKQFSRKIEIYDKRAFVAFPVLEQLTINGMPELNEWVGVEKGDFRVLQKLNISNCSKLRALPELSFFKSLQNLEISLCPSLESFPNGGLPISLQSIVIMECSLLKERCQRDVGKDWEKLARIPSIWID